MPPKIDPQATLEILWNAGAQYANARAERLYVEEYRKTIKAQCMKSSGFHAIGAQEREAYAHPDYVAHLHALRAAVEAEETLRWRLVAAQAAIDIWRTTEASNRAIDRAAT